MNFVDKFNNNWLNLILLDCKKEKARLSCRGLGDIRLACAVNGSLGSSYSIVLVSFSLI